MEIAISDSQSIGTPVHQPTQFIAAAHNHKPCLYCSGQQHTSRSSCPTNGSICNKCHKKCHWASVCLSTCHSTTTRHKPAPKNTALSTDYDEQSNQSQLSSILSAAIESLPSGLVHALVDSIQIDALIDTGSDNTFIKSSFLANNNIMYNNQYCPVILG